MRIKEVVIGRQHVSCHAKSLESCLTLRDTMDCSPPGSSIHGLLQERMLECLPVPSFSGSSWPKDQTQVSWGSYIAGIFFTTKPPGKTILLSKNVSISSNFMTVVLKWPYLSSYLSSNQYMTWQADFIINFYQRFPERGRIL